MPPSHPALLRLDHAARLASERNYANGPGARACAKRSRPASPDDVKRARKTRSAYLSRFRRAAYRQLLEEACCAGADDVSSLQKEARGTMEERERLREGVRRLVAELSEKEERARARAKEAEVSMSEVTEGSLLGVDDVSLAVAERPVVDFEACVREFEPWPSPGVGGLVEGAEPFGGGVKAREHEEGALVVFGLEVEGKHGWAVGIDRLAWGAPSA